MQLHLIRSLHFTPRGYKMGKTLLVLFKMYLKSLVAFQTWHSTSAAQSLFSHETCCICAASVLHLWILCAPAGVRPVLTLLTTNAAGAFRVCRVCVLQLQPENHPPIQTSSREKIFLFNNKLKSPKEVF